MGTDDLIMRVGEVVFGLTWESDTALALDVAEDDLKRWARGEEPPKPGLYDELAVFVAERQDELQWLAAELERREKVGTFTMAGSEIGNPPDSGCR